MPIYEYSCKNCKCTFEDMRPFSRANENAPCPKCKGEGERIMSKCYSSTKSASGATAPVAGTDGGCSSCGGGSCATCGH